MDELPCWQYALNSSTSLPVSDTLILDLLHIDFNGIVSVHIIIGPSWIFFAPGGGEIVLHSSAAVSIIHFVCLTVSYPADVTFSLFLFLFISLFYLLFSNNKVFSLATQILWLSIMFISIFITVNYLSLNWRGGEIYYYNLIFFVWTDNLMQFNTVCPRLQYFLDILYIWLPKWNT